MPTTKTEEKKDAPVVKKEQSKEQKPKKPEQANQQKPAIKPQPVKTIVKKPEAQKAQAPLQARTIAPVKRLAAPILRKASGQDIDIGIDVELPTKACKDQFCPFHGTLSVRGQILEGVVVSDKMQKSVVVKREYMRLDRKYERLEKRTGKYLAHSPPCLEVKAGDKVKIMECRPLSKTISFVVIEKRV